MASFLLSATAPFRVRPSTKSSGSCSSADFLHFAIWMGCTLNCEPSWLSVFSPRIASIATRALKAALCCFLVVVICFLLCVNDSPNSNLLPGLNSWDHYIHHPSSETKAKVRPQHLGVFNLYLSQAATQLNTIKLAPKSSQNRIGYEQSRAIGSDSRLNVT